MSSDGNGFSPLARLIWIHFQSNDIDGLRKELRKSYPQKELVRLLDKGNVPTRRAAALALGLVGDKDAVPPLAKALKADDAGVRVQAENAMWGIWFRSGNDKADALLREGAELMNRRQFERAKEKFEQVIKMQPGFAEAYNQRAILFFMQEEWDKSIADCKKVIELNPYHFGAMAGMGQCYLRKGDVEKAREAFEKALEINPNMMSIRQALMALPKRRRGGRSS